MIREGKTGRRKTISVLDARVETCTKILSRTESMPVGGGRELCSWCELGLFDGYRREAFQLSSYELARRRR